jgi:hypothetical protein
MYIKRRDAIGEHELLIIISAALIAITDRGVAAQLAVALRPRGIAFNDDSIPLRMWCRSLARMELRQGEKHGDAPGKISDAKGYSERAGL